MYSTVMESSPESTYWSSTDVCQYSISNETSSPLGFLGSTRVPGDDLPRFCPNHENCHGEIEVWKNLKKNEVFVQCSGDCKECRHSTKIVTYSNCCVCSFGIVSVSKYPLVYLVSVNVAFIRKSLHI